MNINVTMASGEVDEWEEAADALDDRGSLVVVYHIDGDEVSGKIKTMDVVHETEQGNKGVTYQVAAQYAPGMWIKVEFE